MNSSDGPHGPRTAACRSPAGQQGPGAAMHDLPACGRTFLQLAIARGFADPEDAAQRPRLLCDRLPPSRAAARIAVYLPTMAGRVRSGDMPAFLTDLAREIVTATREQPIECDLYIALQHVGDDAAGAMDCLETVVAALEAQLGDEPDRIGLTAMTLPGPGKVISINAMTRLAAGRGTAAVLLIDDDVSFSPGCFSRLVGAYLGSKQPIALGARKIGQPFETRSSAILHRLKGFTQPAENYPHACCMIVSMEVITPEIPRIYSSDDGYICFRLLDAADANPLHRLVLIDEAYCYHRVGGRDAGEIFSRIRRMLLHHHLFLSHAAPSNSRHYLGSILFFGMWPFVPFDATKGVRRGLIKCALKYVYAAWFAKIGLELILRGLRNRPLREISWGGVSAQSDPETAAT